MHTGDQRRRDERRGERGAVLVHVAVALAGLLAFSALTIDLGVLWVARTQAQNAADAAALSGAVSLAYVDPANEEMAIAASKSTAEAHDVWGETPEGSGLRTSVGECPSGAPDTAGRCVTVAIERGGSGGPPLPAFFSRMFGVDAQRVSASAHAKVMLGNATTCLRPWAVPDRWIDVVDTTPDGAWTPDDLFERYVPGTGQLISGPRDSYVPPSATGTGSGYDLLSVGTQLELYRADIDHPQVAGDAFFMLDMPNAEADEERRYEINIEQCNGMAVAIGDTVPLTHAHLRSTENAVAALVARDPTAYWDGTAVRSQFPVSPRVVAIAIYDPDALAAQPVLQRGTPVVVRNIVGFFVQEFVSAQLRGVIVPMPGTYDPARDQVTEGAAFLRTVALVR